MIVTTYIAYLLFSVSLTIWVARTLFLNGRIFLVDVFAGNEPLADSVNRLLVVGFYLINLGYVSLALKVEGPIPDLKTCIETLSPKLGVVMLVLGAMHFLNIAIFSSYRASQMKAREARERMDQYRQAGIPPIQHR